MKSWIADNGDGTYTNPLFYDEFSDPDMIRVGDDYYLTGTTMHAMPGLPVLRSRDLVNWEFVSYACDRLDLGPEFRLEEGKNVYGQGIWAPCIRHHNGVFHIFANVNRHKTQHFQATNAVGPWTHSEMRVSLHDLSVLFDDDGKSYAVWGYQEIHLAELTNSLEDIVPGTDRVIIPHGSGVGEGSHFLKVDGAYYLFFAVYDPTLYMVCARSNQLDGPYEVTTISANEALGASYGNRLAPGSLRDGVFQVLKPDAARISKMALHQGAIVDTPTGEWWGYSMMDHNSVGRLTCLSPITWSNGWPYFGLPGNLGRSPITWAKPNIGAASDPSALYERCDDFSSHALKPVWQWNHCPVDSAWSLSERHGALRLYTLPADDLWNAKNSLTQRAIGPESTATVEVNVAGLVGGDCAGLGLLNVPFASMALTKEDQQLSIRLFNQLSGQTEIHEIDRSLIWLRVACDFDREVARFSYSEDGNAFRDIGDGFDMIYQGATFQGVRYALFAYNTSGMSGGFADFANFVVEEPRAIRQAGRAPVGRIVSLTSNADGVRLLARNGVIVSALPTDEQRSGDVRDFVVEDRECGRVAFRAHNGGYVTVCADGGPGDIRIEPAGDELTQTFQWIDMQGGCSALLSLATHRYLHSVPRDPGLVSADSQGPAPSRLDGSTWRVSPLETPTN
jgi:beta-xylosidase